MTKILIIGGTGFIGYHIIKEAKKRKWDITSISKNKPLIKRLQKKIKYKFVNTTNLSLLEKKISGNFDYVINTGGYGNNPKFGKIGDKLFNSHYKRNIYWDTL